MARNKVVGNHVSVMHGLTVALQSEQGLRDGHLMPTRLTHLMLNPVDRNLRRVFHTC